MLGKAGLMSNIIPDNASQLWLDYQPHEALSFAATVRDLASITRHYSNNYRLHALGYSLGGRVLFNALPTIEKYLSSIAFISSGLPLSDTNDQKAKVAFDQMAIQQSKQLSPNEFFDWWHELPIYNGVNKKPGFQDYKTKLLQTFSLSDFIQIIQSLSVNKMQPNLYSTSINSIYFFGEYDTKYRDIANQYTNFFNKIMISPIKNASHLCWFEQPQIIQKQLLALRDS